MHSTHVHILYPVNTLEPRLRAENNVMVVDVSGTPTLTVITANVPSGTNKFAGALAWWTTVVLVPRDAVSSRPISP